MTETRRLGSSQLHTPKLCLGGNVFGWTADKTTSFAILDAFACEPQLAAAFRAGGRLTDADVRSLYDDLVAMGKIRS